MNPLIERMSGDGVNLFDLAPPVYVLSTHEIPTVSEFTQFNLTKKCHVGNGNKTHFVEFYLNGYDLSRVFQSRARAMERVADMATAIANQKVKEALNEALKEGGAS